MKFDINILFATISLFFLTTCQDKDEMHNVWEKLTPPDTLYRVSPVSFAIDGKGYHGLGYHGQLVTDWWQYDPRKNTWARKSDFPGHPRRFCFSITDGRNGYIGPGYDIDLNSNLISLKDIWQYDAEDDRWSALTTVPFTFADHVLVSFAIDGKLFVINNQEVWSFDFMTKSWQRKKDLPFVFKNSIFDPVGNSIVIENEPYLLFNDDSHSSGLLTGSIWKYDSKSDTWQEVRKNINVGEIEWQSIFNISDDIYIANTGFSLWERIDLGKNGSKFEYVVSMKLEPHPDGTAYTINNMAYVFISSGEFWRYTP